MLIAVPIGLVLLAIWQTMVDTSPTLSDEDRIRGWGTVIRELPATLLLAAVPIAGLVLAVRAGRNGAVDSAHRAVLLHGVALFFVLLVILNGSAENIMTTRPATVKWLLFPIQGGVAIVAVIAARRLISGRRQLGQ